MPLRRRSLRKRLVARLEKWADGLLEPIIKSITQDRESAFASASRDQTRRASEGYVLGGHVKSPERGLVSHRSAEEGQMASPDRPLLAIVDTDEVWVVANFKEDQLRRMGVGQKATVRLDTYGRLVLRGHVDSLGGAAGARFAVLPPDNASGNFVKVVQRIPVLVRLDARPGVPLRPGSSATVEVDTR